MQVSQFILAYTYFENLASGKYNYIQQNNVRTNISTCSFYHQR